MAPLTLLLSLLAGSSLLAQESPTPPQEARREALARQLASPDAGHEKNYSEKVYTQCLEYLHTLYTHPDTQVTLASFSDDAHPGDDRGFGLHETRLLEMDGRTVSANIHWPFLPQQCGFTLPDEIRVRAQAFPPGKNQAPNPAKDFVVSRFRVTWDDQNEPSIHLEPQYNSEALDGKNHRRVPVSVFSCITCHDTGNGHAPTFLAPGEKLDPRIIVQKSQYGLPLEETEGYLQLETYLQEWIPDPKNPKDPTKRKPRYTPEQAKPLLAALKHKSILDIPAMGPYLRKIIDTHSISTFGDDFQVRADHANNLPMRIETGTYTQNGALYMESTESVMRSMGKGIWWSEPKVIPADR